MSGVSEKERADLQAAIEAVYAAFARYRPPIRLEAAPKHDVPEVLKRLRSAPLRQLDAETLGPFAGSALYTIGDVPDYKHFLPRILELATSEQVHVGLEAWAIARKLVYGGWPEWPRPERAAIRTLCRTAWQVLRGKEPEDGDAPAWLYANAMIGEDIAPLLRDWSPSVQAGGLSHVVTLVIVAANPREETWEDAPPAAINALAAWREGPELKQRLLDALDLAGPEGQWHIEQALSALGV